MASFDPLEPRLNGEAVDAPVSTIMSRIVISVSPKVTIDRVIRLLLEHNIGGAPVVNAQGRPIGMISRSDLVSDQYASTELPRSEQEKRRGRQVREIMTTVCVSVPETTPIPRVAAVLWKHHLHRAPVVNDKGAITGIITSSDILRWVAEQTGANAPSRAFTRMSSVELVTAWARIGFDAQPTMPPSEEPS